MSISYTFDSETGFIRTRCAGDISLDDTLEHLRAVEADPQLQGRRLTALLDLRRIASLPETSQLRGATKAIDGMQKTLIWGPWALVADRDSVFGMARMFQVFLEDLGVECRVFRDMREAERWLESTTAASD